MNMILDYPDKASGSKILHDALSKDFSIQYSNDNLIIKGDNFDALAALIKGGYSGRVDLIYIDPPFATNQNFHSELGRSSSISHSKNSPLAYADTLVGHEFIEFIRHRLYLLKELLSDEGSIYLHIDYKIGHYVKIIMDEVFGGFNFRNDITRIKCNPKNFGRNSYGNVKDLILFYSKSKNPIWNNPVEAKTEEAVLRLFKKKNYQGRFYTTVPIHAPGETKDGPTGRMWRHMMPPKGRHWRCSPEELDALDSAGLIEWSKTGNPRRIIFADEKKSNKRQDIWDFKDKSSAIYPTEKNIDMLEMIVKASSNECSIVLDCFCGSGSTLLAAKNNGRRFIGIDQSTIAIDVTTGRELGNYKFIDLANF
jgi:adenine-specific DNA-methyltransferase